MAKRRESKGDKPVLLDVRRDAVRSSIARFKKHGFETPTRNNHGSKMDSYKVQVIEYLEKGLSAMRIYEELCNIGASVSDSTVSHYVHKIKLKIKYVFAFILHLEKKHR